VSGGAPFDTDADHTTVGLDGQLYAVGGFLEREAVEGSRSTVAAADADTFRAAMSQLASGVVMVTTRVGGRPWGLTVSACCSVSAEPPLLLVCLNRRTQSWRAIESQRAFGVSILAESHHDLAVLGSAPGNPKFIDEFSVVDPDDVASVPVVRGALYHLKCAVVSMHQAGTHSIVIGQVRTAERGGETGLPLVYFDRTYHRLGNAVPRA